MAENLYDELIANAKAAFINKQYAVSLEYYSKALEINSDDLELLSRAGMLAVLVGKIDDAYDYFMHALEIDPMNGDNYYNLGNAYFFQNKLSESLDMFTKAESLPCSEEVVKKLYFQKGMICSARGDLDAALMYLDKYEKSCGNDKKAIDPRLFSSKADICFKLGKLEEAELNAAKLVNIQPTVFANYLKYYYILMSLKKYDKAEDILISARDYATKSEEEQYTLGILEASFYVEMMSVFYDDEETKARCEKYASDIYTEMLESSNPVVEKSVVKLGLADLHMHAKKYDSAIEMLKSLIPAEEILHTDVSDIEFASKALDADGNEVRALEESSSDDEIVAIDDDEDIITDDDEIVAIDDDEDIITDDDESVAIDDDEDIITDDPDVAQESEEDSDEDAEMESTEKDDADQYGDNEDSDVFIERVIFSLMTCYINKDDYKNALAAAERLIDSSNDYYKYTSRYCRAYSIKKLVNIVEGITEETADRAYAKAIAFYRSQMMKDPADKLAVIMRARMYAEQGKYEKAGEMAKLLVEDERDELEKYFDKCRAGEA